MKGKALTYYWDSGVVIPFFNAKIEPDHAKLTKLLLEDAEAGKIEIITSTFTLVEVIKLDRDRKLTSRQENQIVAFFEKPYIRLINADRIVCEAARHLIWKHPTLKPKDSVHLASALSFAEKRTLDALFAWDSDFTKLDGVATTKFPICQPYEKNPKLPGWVEAQAPPPPQPPTP